MRASEQLGKAGMEFYKQRIRYLKSYQSYREHSPTMWSVIRASRKVLMIWAVFIFVLSMLPHDSKLVIGLKYFGIGLFCGAILRFIGYARASVNIAWPILSEVIDWDKVDEKCAAFDAD